MAASSADSTNQISKARKRLSIVSANTLADGLSNASIEDEKQAAAGELDNPLVTSYVGISRKGFAPYNPSKANQDCLIMRPTVDGSLILCVMDGHGESGEVVSGFLQRTWPDLLAAHPAFFEDVETALQESIADAEHQLLTGNNTKDLVDFSGTTFVAALIRNDDIWVANIGDSRITKASNTKNGFLATAMSEDHKPDLPAEKARIQAKGGRVFAVTYDDGIDGPSRVWLKNMDIPGLAMSRSLGDTVAHSAGVNSIPEIFHSKITPDMAFLVLASDGLWEFMDDQCVVDMVVEHSAKDPNAICEILINEAKNRWMAEEEVVDDTTVVLVNLNGFPNSRGS